MSLPILLIALVACALIAGYFYMARQQRSQLASDWASVVSKLQPLPAPGLTAVAETYLHPRSNQIELDPEAIFALLGGAQGLRVMRQNAAVMLQLAGYATRWNHVEAVVVTEMIRRDARRLQNAIFMIRLELFWRRMAFRAPFRLQEAAAAYHLMTCRLSALYESSHQGLYPVLAASL
jgi:hypothetical protein